MNDSRTVHVSTVVIAVLWGVVFINLGIGWVLIAFGHRATAMMLGFTTMAIVALAVVATLRLYMIRVSGMIRALHGIGRPDMLDLEFANVERLR